jgi:mannitol 2-dehydrogenase
MSQSAHSKSTSDIVDLNSKNLDVLPSNIRKPHYDRNTLETGIVHMSVGGFHRAHQAVYLDDVLNKNSSNWMISGVGLMPQDAQNFDALKQQDCLYSVLERSPTEDKVRVVGSIKELIHAPSDVELVINKIASPSIKIISLTITEKGYYYNEKRNLDLTSEQIKYDIALPSSPKTAYGYLVKGLQKRKEDNAGAVTIMCCDNLPGNGHITQHLLGQFITESAPDLLPWLNENVSFPNAMVDRITPVTTPLIQDILRDNFSLQDGWPVVCEDYIQWILEDKFIAGRPAFETVGVQMVDDVEPYERMKVRLLNGSHSALSYISYLLGHRNVDKAMADPLVCKFVEQYMNQDITPSLPSVPGIDLVAYKQKLIERFSNPSISDQVSRLAEDGSQKIRNAIVPPLEYQLENNGSIKHIAFALAAWWRYLAAVDEGNNAILINDPMSERLTQKAKLLPRDPVGLLSFDEIFGKTLVDNAKLRNLMSEYLNDMYDHGTKQSLERFLKP